MATLPPGLLSTEFIIIVFVVVVVAAAAQGMDRWLALVNVVMNLWVP
jgi:uncharacterized membrane protein